jgi:hypothetical protein
MWTVVPVIVLFGCYFLLVGIESLQGTADGTLRNGIVSVAFGQMIPDPYVGAAIGIRDSFPMTGWALALSGVLALAWRGRYQEWRRTQPGGKEWGRLSAALFGAAVAIPLLFLVAFAVGSVVGFRGMSSGPSPTEYGAQGGSGALFLLIMLIDKYRFLPLAVSAVGGCLAVLLRRRSQ